MSTSTNQTEIEVFDGRELPCETKRPAFLSRCIQLPAGQSFVFLNSHDPMPLRTQLDRSYPGSFAWEHLEPDDDETIRLKVTKLRDPEGGFSAADTELSCS